MSRFRTVFLFELKGYLKNKVVIGVTLFLIVASAVLLFSPRFMGGGDAGPKQAAEDRPVMLVRAEDAVRGFFIMKRGPVQDGPMIFIHQLSPLFPVISVP